MSTALDTDATAPVAVAVTERKSLVWPNTGHNEKEGHRMFMAWRRSHGVNDAKSALPLTNLVAVKANCCGVISRHRADCIATFQAPYVLVTDFECGSALCSAKRGAKANNRKTTFVAVLVD